MASVEGVRPAPTSAGIRGMDGEPALHRQFFISSLYAAMGGYTGEPAKVHGLHVFFAAYVSAI